MGKRIHQTGARRGKALAQSSKRMQRDLARLQRLGNGERHLTALLDWSHNKESDELADLVHSTVQPIPLSPAQIQAIVQKQQQLKRVEPLRRKQWFELTGYVFTFQTMKKIPPARVIATLERKADACEIFFGQRNRLLRQIALDAPDANERQNAQEARIPIAGVLRHIKKIRQQLREWKKTARA